VITSFRYLFASPESEAVAGGEDGGSGFFQRCLAKSRGSTPEKQRLWRDGIYDEIREVMPMQGSLSVERMCQMARVSRAGFYRSLQERVPREESMEVRSAIQRTVLEHRRRYGYRRVTAELRRQGMLVNHKRVSRIMREDNLLAVQPKQFVTTTDSNNVLEVYLNLARRKPGEGRYPTVARRFHLMRPFLAMFSSHAIAGSHSMGTQSI
jgi:hypothetical protein